LLIHTINSLEEEIGRLNEKIKDQEKKNDEMGSYWEKREEEGGTRISLKEMISSMIATWDRDLVKTELKDYYETRTWLIRILDSINYDTNQHKQFTLKIGLAAVMEHVIDASKKLQKQKIRNKNLVKELTETRKFVSILNKLSRHDTLLNTVLVLISHDMGITIEKLAKITGQSLLDIRRDLLFLEKLGMIDRHASDDDEVIKFSF